MNMDSRNQEQLISQLYQLIEYELEQPDDEMDMDLISECSDYLEELQAGENELSEEEILSRIKQIKQQVSPDSSTVKPIPLNGEKRKRPLFLKIFVPIAAIFLTFIITLTAVSCSNRTILGKFLSDHLRKISLILSNGETVEKSDMTVTKASTDVTYQSVEEMLDQENLTILFPQPLPNEIAVEKIRKYQVDDEQFIIVFYFKNQTLQMVIKNYYQMEYDRNTYIEKLITDTMCWYVYKLDGSYSSSCQYNGYEYVLDSENLDLLKQMIENMKEFEK